MHLSVFSQQTKVFGVVTNEVSGELLPFVRVQFQNSKIGALTDTNGYFEITTYYATDSLQFFSAGFIPQSVKINKDVEQEINVKLKIEVDEIEEITILPPDEFPSTTLHKKVIAHKHINNKEKLASYEYEVYNKMRMDLNNIGDKFEEMKVIKKLDVVMNYLDTSDKDRSSLPLILSETVSDFYFKNNPKRKREIVKGTQITGVDYFQINQLLGDMYMDINIYDNNINIISRSFVSPVSDIARSYYKFYLEDSTFIGKQWCYKLRFVPKRTGDMTMEGEMWIHDTTYAVKRFKANLSPGANINYINDLYFEHEFEMVQPEVWMLTKEKLIADVKFTKKSKIYGVYARKTSSRKNFAINTKRPDAFYKSDFTVEFQDSAKKRSEEFWNQYRHEPLDKIEQGVVEMVDSLEQVPYFKTLKNLAYFATTGYYPIGKIELGSAFSFVSYNYVEKFRMGLALRTSNNFSRRFEIGGKIAYGFGDEKFKYGGTVRYNITPKKRGMLVGYYLYDIEQIGASPSASAVGSTFSTLLRTGRLDKLTFVEKVGVNLEKDFKKDIILYGGFEWKEYKPLGRTSYVKVLEDGSHDSIRRITSSEFTLRFRWTKNEEFVGGSFDRKSLRSRYPILSLQGIFGIKGLLGSHYNYQKLEFQLLHNALIGPLGKIKYGFTAGYTFGTAPFPFLKVHEGNESYWLQSNSYNAMKYFEFISDKYVSGFVENHWNGLLFDRIPLIKKLKWRLVTTVKATYGSIGQQNLAMMKLPDYTKSFGKTPYIETAVGIENIFKFGRIDLVYRPTHNAPGTKFINHLAIRARLVFIF